MKQTELKELLDTLQEINGVIEKFDPAIREKAFDLVAERLRIKPSGTSSHVQRNPTPSENNETGSKSAPSVVVSSPGDFFSQYDHGKPAINVELIVAWLFSQYGACNFSTSEIKEIADSVRITVPSRIDMTLKAKRNGKAIYHKVGKSFKLTVHGELYIKQTYNVVKGTSSKDSE